ncbi:MAG: energy transducer TonB [Bryobacteraceae bacterium]
MLKRNALPIVISLLSIPALAGSAVIGNSLIARNASGQTRLTARGVVQDGKLVRMTTPDYPVAAKQAQVSGMVTVVARIGKDGHVAETSVLRGPYPLRRVAEDAVKQWQYEPTLLDGEPVQRVAVVNLNFVLGRYSDLMDR